MGLPAKKLDSQGGSPSRPSASKAVSPKIVQLNKGDILFKEGDRSRAMYILQEGSLRLFKKKGAGCIELAVIHHGEVIGELAFFDGEPRSASAEALSPCKLIVISFEQMQAQLSHLPSWLKSIIESVVKRLRQASTKVKQLENAGVQYYSSDGKAAVYNYMLWPDVLKFLASLLLVASRYGKDNGKGEKSVNPTHFQLIASSMFGAPLSKLMDFLDVLQEQDLVRMEQEGDQFTIIVQHMDILDASMHYIHTEQNKDERKRIFISKPCLKLLKAAYAESNGKTPDENGICEISIKKAVSRIYGENVVESLVLNENWSADRKSVV